MDKKPAAINVIWLYLVLLSILVAAYTGKMDQITKGSFESAKNAVNLAISLIGAMALWLGLMKVAEAAGLMKAIAKAIRPLMIRLFPDVPSEHPAMSAMIMNMAANMLGLGNAATPMGIKAMSELEKINPEKGTATNAMCLFLAINTSSVTILPLGVIAVRAAAGATSPASILVPAILATLLSTTAAIIASKLLASRSPAPVYTKEAVQNSGTATENTVPETELTPPGILSKITAYAMIPVFLFAIPYHFISTGRMPHFNLDFINNGTTWLVPLIMGSLLIYGYIRGVKVYETVTEGAKEGFQVATRIIPFMVAIFVGIGMFRDSGALDIFTNAVLFVLRILHLPPDAFPADVLPMALLRPLSGSGSFAMMSEIINRSPNSFSAFLASIVQGSTETTFYVLAVYFGAIGIKKSRHALPAALIADFVGISGSLLLSHLMFK